MKGIPGFIEGGSCGSIRGENADRQTSNIAATKMPATSHELPLRPAKKPTVSMAAV